MKKFTLPALLALVAFIFTAGALQAQIQMPAPSPLSTVTQRIGLTDVTISYSRPSVRNRKIFGEVVPFGKMWRTGANASTTIKFSDPVTVQGKKVEAGEYSLYTIPAQNEWTIMLSKNTKLGGDVTNYKTEEEAIRFTVNPTTTAFKTETFTINFTDLTTTSGNVEMLWENTSVKFNITTEVETKMMAQIQEKVINGKDVTPNMYATAAIYYYDTNKDSKQALEWIKKANEKDPKFWNLHTQAKIEAKNKDYKNAIKTAEKSKELAKAAKNDDYVRMNDEKIAEWKKIK